MKVRTSLLLLSTVFVILVIVLGYVVFRTSDLIIAEVEDSESATQIIKEVSELSVLTFEYTSHHEERMEQQWFLKYDSLGRLLEGLRSEEADPEHLAKLEKMTSDYESIGDVFVLLQVNYDERVRLIEDNATQAEIDLSLASEDRLSAQLLLRSQRLTTEAFEFSAIHRQTMVEAQGIANWITLLSIAGFAVLAFSISLLTARAIVRPLDKLARSAKTIGEGDLRHRADVKTKNEIGILAQSFNQMTERLVEDITERELAEVALALHTKELERSNAELARFAHVASHDLQEPLRTVTSYVQLLERRYQGQLDADADEFINYAVKGAARMQQLIVDLLAFSRLDSRAKEFSRVDCNDPLGQALSNLKAAIREAGAAVTHDPLPTVVGDPSQLASLFQNLIGNAIKFRGEEPPRIHVSAESSSKEWTFSVRDNGIGIDPKYGERIFIIFQRLHRTDEYPGTGVGLALCKKIVERHGGRIWVESRPGEGSTFHFTIPMGGSQR